MTSDGKYYVAVVLPVTHSELPATEQVFAQTEAEVKEYRTYMTKTVAWQDQESGSNFTPDLSKLDAMLSSLEIK